MSSHVENEVQARIAAARRREAERKQQREELAAARDVGLGYRHAQRLRNLANTPAPTTEDAPMPAALRPAVCPSCRRERPARLVATVVVSGAPHDVVRCVEQACELMWLVRAERPRTAPVAA
ncbi:MAG: hypothetical protein HOY79_40315 [Streptomyces sp.]|nr:hypothetical protein [Streptomyces sp.]